MVSRDSYNVCIAVYMMASRCHGTIYIGVTSRFFARIYEHRNDLVDGFTKKYGVHRLVWYEVHESIVSAIQREKSLKKYKRDWKINLIERQNPHWDDLYPVLVGMRPVRNTQVLAGEEGHSRKQLQLLNGTGSMGGRHRAGHDEI